MQNQMSTRITNACSAKSPLIVCAFADNKENMCSQNVMNDSCASASTQNVTQDFIHSVVNNAIKSEIISLVNDATVALNECCRQSYNAAIICDNVLQIAISTRASKYKWKKERKYRITGSR